MSTPPAIYGQFGQALGFAERTLTASLREHLAKRDTEPETWYALQLVATRGPGLAREELIRVLSSSRSFGPDAARELLARLEAERLLRGDQEIDLTPEGEAFHRSLREYIGARTERLLNHFDLADVETTVRTLQAITQRASEQLESPVL